MKIIYKITCLLLIMTFASCKGEQEIEDTKFIGFDQISKIILSPNSSQLIADGKAELRFKAKCYYKLNDTTEVAMIMDRVPVEQIKITSSDGKTFGINDAYSTTSSQQEVSFTCSIGNTTSPKVAVKLTPKEEPKYEEITVPIIFHAIYTDAKQNNIQSLTPELVQEIVDRANKVFANQLYNAPSSCPSGIKFEVAGIHKVKISDTEMEDAATYIKENLMNDYNKYLNVWVLDNLPWGLYSEDCIPRYTLGSADNIPGLDLEEISSIDDIEDIDPMYVGITTTFSDLYQTKSGNSETRFETQLGRFYGLLDTGNSDIDYEDFEDNDLDYCPDTYSYIIRYATIEKNTFALYGTNNDEARFYDSFNIMDMNSRCTTISRDQVKRIRKVIQECAFRQMKK